MYMKIRYLLLLILPLLLLPACKTEEVIEPWQSNALEQYTLTPIPGGVSIEYVLPNDQELLYILAEYERGGKPFTEKSSIYKNEIVLEGFNTTENVEATIYKVNKKEQKSEPLKINFNPLTPPIQVAYESLDIMTAFGGILATWINISQTEFGVRLMTEVDGELETSEVYFTTIPEERHYFRGFPDVLTTFAISFEDKWGNISDTVRYTTTPYFEKEIEKPFLDYRLHIPYDNISLYSTRFPIENMWDGIVGFVNNGYMVQSGEPGLSFTFDLRKVAKLSRMIVWPRLQIDQWWTVYRNANIMSFEMWGIDKIDPATLANRDYWLDDVSAPPGKVVPEYTFKDDWTYLGLHNIERLDKLGASSSDIRQRGIDGHMLDIPIEADPVRYIRIFVRENTDGSPPPNNFYSIGEISFFGDDRIE
jgi:hypothetical protein